MSAPRVDGRARRGRHGHRQRPRQANPARTDLLSVGVGGRIATFGTAQAENATISDNHASTNDNDVDGTITP